MNKRTIKFRAWDKTKSYMIYDGDNKWMPGSYPVSVSNKGVIFCKKLGHDGNIVRDEEGNIGYTNWEYDAFYQDVILMQFTGLLDKNSVEIYEGDIVKDGSSHLTEVIWDHSRWCFAHTDCAECYSINVGVEVVGNIYENLELLGK